MRDLSAHLCPLVVHPVVQFEVAMIVAEKLHHPYDAAGHTKPPELTGSEGCRRDVTLPWKRYGDAPLTVMGRLLGVTVWCAVARRHTCTDSVVVRYLFVPVCRRWMMTPSWAWMFVWTLLFVRYVCSLSWALSRQCEAAIITAFRNVNLLIDDLDLQVVCFDKYGKGFMKEYVGWGTAPPAVVVLRGLETTRVRAERAFPCAGMRTGHFVIAVLQVQRQSGRVHPDGDAAGVLPRRRQVPRDLRGVHDPSVQACT